MQVIPCGFEPKTANGITKKLYEYGVQKSIEHVIFPINSWEMGVARSSCGFGKMLEALSILHENQGQSQAAPLAAGV